VRAANWCEGNRAAYKEAELDKQILAEQAEASAFEQRDVVIPMPNESDVDWARAREAS
jgi:hypothetical protein